MQPPRTTHRHRRLAPWLLPWLLLALATVDAGEPGVQEHWYPALLDHQPTGLTVLVLERDGRRFVRPLDLAQLGIDTPQRPDHRHAGEPYVAAARLKDLTLHVDPVTRTAHFIQKRPDHLAEPPSTELLLDVTINGRTLPELVLLEHAEGELRLEKAALAALGIDVEKLPGAAAGGIGIHDLAGESFSYDASRLTLEMTVPPHLLQHTDVAVQEHQRAGNAPGKGYSAILGYDFNAGFDNDGESWQAGLVEFAGSNGRGTCEHRHAWRSRASHPTRRLDSYCSWDWPHHLLSLSIGDGISTGGTLGQSVRYGGVRLGTDFALAPQLITQPTIALEGSARVPSTLELWVDQMLTLRRDLPAGPFSLLDIPVHTGSGMVEAVITDMLGNRQVISRSFYSDPTLLAPGLSDWSLELGRTRVGFGSDNDHYADDFALLAGRRGLNDWLTLGGRLEAMEESRMVAMDAGIRLGDFGIMELGLLTSAHDGRRGQAGMMGFSRRGKRLSGGFRHFVSDPDFVQLGYSTPGSAPASETQANLGVVLGRGISMNVGAQLQEQHHDERRAFVSAALNIPVGRFGSLTVSAFEPIDPIGDTLLSAFLTMPLDDGRTLSSSLSSSGGSFDGSMTVQSNVPAGPGHGYRMTADRRSGRSGARGEYIRQGNRVRMSAAADYRDGNLAAQVRASGAVVMTPLGLSLSRLESGSFGMVQLPTAGVRVYHDERLAAVTDASGQAVIPGLRPYQRNRVRVSLDDLPIESQIRVAELELVPGRRQALAASFDIETARYLAAYLDLPDGQPVPAGATIELPAPLEDTVVGHDGMVFLSIGDQNELSVHARWPQRSCRAALQVPESEAAVIELGRLTCQPESS